MADVARDLSSGRALEGPLIAPRWRSRRAAAVAGIVFAVLLTAGLVIVRATLPATGLTDLAADPGRRRLLQLGLNLAPFAGIAFLWFIGVIRDQIGAVEDRLFSTVFLGSGLLFVAMLFLGAVVSTSLLQHVGSSATRTPSDILLWDYGRDATRTLVSVYAMRMAAVFTMSTATIALRTRIVPRWIGLLGIAVAVVLLVTVGLSLWVELLFPAWILLLSVEFLRTGLKRAPLADATTADPG